MKKLYIDFETRSRADIKKVGAWAYAAHPSTEILCMAYSFDGKPAEILLPEKLSTQDGMVFVQDDILVAHNAHFEYAIYHNILVKRFGWPAIEDPKRWDCTLSRAAMCNLPLSLDKLGQALGISAKKDLAGRQAMLKLCKPTADGSYNEDPALKRVLYDYCKRDVEAEMEIDKRLPQLPPMERAIWELDLEINRRGVQMDVPLARAATTLAGELTLELNDRLSALTNGAVSKASRVAEIKRWLATQGMNGESSLDKSAVTALLDSPIVAKSVKDVLSIRRQVGKSSTAKFEAVMNVAGTDSRARGLLQYHAASTGRWGGRLFQPQNLPKGLGEDEQGMAIDNIKNRPSLFSLLYGDKAMDTLSGVLRGCIIAVPGKQLVVADYSAIEARVVLWLAGDEKGLDMFRQGKSLYLDMAEFIYKKKGLTKKDAVEYAVGKAVILGCGFGMGKVRFRAQCATWGIDVSEDLAAQAIRAYREKYSSVKKMWYEVEKAARSARKTPGSVHACCGGKVHFGMDKKREFLCALLPSGRHLRYFKPTIVGGEYGEEIHYQGPGLGGAIEDQKTYGGSLTENIVQAVARDLMAAAMLKCEAAGYPIILSVHDELIAEWTPFPSCPDPLVDFIKLMCHTPAWAKGLPVNAEGWVGNRYRK